MQSSSALRETLHSAILPASAPLLLNPASSARHSSRRALKPSIVAADHAAGDAFGVFRVRGQQKFGDERQVGKFCLLQNFRQRIDVFCKFTFSAGI